MQGGVFGRLIKPLRWVLPLAAALAGTVSADGLRLRIAAANLTSGNGQNYDPGEGIDILQGIDPDICLIQEFNYQGNTAANLRTFVDTAFGTSFSFFRETGAQIPNGVISRYPIVQSGQWNDPQLTNRDFVWAKIDLPGEKDLWAVSVHLHSSGGAGSRQTEAQEIVSKINATVTAGDYLVIGGDFNTDTRSEACLSTLAAVVLTAGPYPADKNGNQNTNAGRSKPYDAVYPDADLHALRTPVRIGNNSFTNGTVIDTRVYTPIADLAPAQADSSSASNMQHMAVIRDFLIPLPADPPELALTATHFTPGASPRFAISFQSTAYATYLVQSTDSLTAASWSTLGQIQAGGATTTVTVVTTNPAAAQVRDTLLGSAQRRFYRVIRQP